MSTESGTQPVAESLPEPPTFVPIVAKRGLGVAGTVLVAALTAAVVGLGAGVGGYFIGTQADNTTTSTASSIALPQAPAELSPPAAGSVAEVVAAVLPSVVSIVVEGESRSGSGSGFVLRSDGYILTNNHVVGLLGDGGKLGVVFNDGTKASGEVVGTNPAYDLAVVKVSRKDLPSVTLGNSDAVHVGDSVIAIGAPLGLAGTVTAGIVSAINRPVTTGGDGEASFINAIQTDAAINPGNSGGPLLNSSGQVTGINSAIATMASTGDSGSIGLGFAIPVNSAKRIAEEIIATGDSRTPVIGVSLDINFSGVGAKLSKVTASSAAAAAGLEVGDVITAVNGRAIRDATELVVAIRDNAPGEKITVSYERDSDPRTATVTLGSASGKG
ncbi:MAG: trypsin-like peptidase domain-containing protein [Actinomycetota bacterium]|nr:trypsin-like peptidase domain-containing protein [Actinomycetota bacterium]